MIEPAVVVVGAGRFQVALIEAVQRRGLRVIALDGDAGAPGLSMADEHHVVDISDRAACLAIARAAGPIGVVTVAAEVAVPTVAAIAAALGLPGPTPDAALAATDKAVMRQRLVDGGVACPAWSAVRDQRAAERAAQSTGLPVVIKPADSAGSRGVRYVSDPADVAAAFETAGGHSRTGVVLVEAFVPGTEVSVELLVANGEAIVVGLSRKERTAPPALLDTTVLFPADLGADVEPRVIETARAAVAACGIDDAAVHLELILGPTGPVVVELAARGAGFHVFTEMVPWSSGIDVVGALVDIATGRPQRLPVPLRRGAALLFPEAPPGRVLRVAGLAAVRALPWVIDADVYVAPGDVVRPLRSGSDRLGHVIAIGETGPEALDRAHEAAAMLELAVDTGIMG